MTIELAVNGRSVAFAADPATPLLDVLRNHLGLKGSRYGCGLEQCGACMVLIDGQAGVFLRAGGRVGRRPFRRHDRGSWDARRAASVAARLPGRAGWPVRLLPVRHHHQRHRAAATQPRPAPRRHRGRAGQAPVPLRRAHPDHRRRAKSRRHGSNPHERHPAAEHRQQPPPGEMAAVPARPHGASWRSARWRSARAC